MSTQTADACAFCGREMTRGGMARHLHACAKRQEVQAEAEKSRRHRQKLYHLQVQDTWSSAYWLHLEMRGNATLKVNSLRVGVCGYAGPAEPP